MKFSIVTLIALLLSFCCRGQLLYKCSYTDSVGITDFDKQITAMRQSLIEKGLTKEMAEAYISNFFQNEHSFSQTQERLLFVYNDSSVIELNYSANKDFQSLQLPSRKLIIKKGQLFRFNSSMGSYVSSKLSDSSQIFTPLSGKREILGYDCNEYISLDSSYKIWVTNDLPPEINPGIGVKNINGAILCFETKKGNAITRSCIKEIEKKPTMKAD